MRPIILPAKMGSKGAKALKEGLRGARKVYPNRNYRPFRSHLIINWGMGTYPAWNSHPVKPVWLNKPEAVENASDKVKAFEIFKLAGISTPEFTTDRVEARDWAERGSQIVCRTLSRGSEGRGIVMASAAADVVQAPLYVKYVKKTKEFRIHVCNGAVIDMQEKRVRSGSEGNDFEVRSHANGWVFCHDNVEVSEAAKQYSIAAVFALGLDFGAVDLIYNEHYGMYYVLEVNTAPGLEGQTLNKYLSAFRRLV